MRLVWISAKPELREAVCGIPPDPQDAAGVADPPLADIVGVRCVADRRDHALVREHPEPVLVQGIIERLPVVERRDQILAVERQRLIPEALHTIGAQLLGDEQADHRGRDLAEDADRELQREV